MLSSNSLMWPGLLTSFPPTHPLWSSCTDVRNSLYSEALLDQTISCKLNKNYYYLIEVIVLHYRESRHNIQNTICIQYVCKIFFVTFLLNSLSNTVLKYRWEEEVLGEGLPPVVSEVSEVQQTAHSWTTCRGICGQWMRKYMRKLASRLK